MRILRDPANHVDPSSIDGSVVIICKSKHLARIFVLAPILNLIDFQTVNHNGVITRSPGMRGAHP